MASATKVDDVNGASAAGVCPLNLDAFIGEWKDSMGHLVNVVWARAGNRYGQLDVGLTRPKGGEPIRLNIKELGNGRFLCGHYELDAARSWRERIVWVDQRGGKTSV